MQINLNAWSSLSRLWGIAPEFVLTSSFEFDNVSHSGWRWSSPSNTGSVSRLMTPARRKPKRGFFVFKPFIATQKRFV